MVWGQPKQASSATMAITFITLGSLTDVWTIVYYIYLRKHGADDTTFLWVYGFFFTGLVLMTIGFLVGWIGRSAKQAEVAAQPAVIANPGVAPAAVAPGVTAAGDGPRHGPSRHGHHADGPRPPGFRGAGHRPDRPAMTRIALRKPVQAATL